MDSTLLAIRAITAHYGRQLLWPILWAGTTAYVVLFAVIWWLAAQVSSWWWILELILTPMFIAGLALWALCFVIIRRIHPRINKQQQKLVREIVAHAAHIAGEMGTPKFIILGRIVRDVVFGSSVRGSYIGELTAEPGEAKRKFDELRRSL